MDEEKFTCPTCGEEFPTQADLDEHLKNDHEEVAKD